MVSKNDSTYYAMQMLVANNSVSAVLYDRTINKTVKTRQGLNPAMLDNFIDYVNMYEGILWDIDFTRRVTADIEITFAITK